MVETFILISFGLMGLCVGSFLNVVIYRLPNNLSIIKPPSNCPVCGRMIKPYENIPVISYIFLRGKCAGCKNGISAIYPAVELLTAVLWVLPVIYGFDYMNACVAAIFSTILLAVFFIDFKYMIIPNELVIAIIVLSLPLFFIGNDIVWYNRLIGFVVGGGVLYLLAIFSEKAFKKEGMGGGDIKLMAAAGLMLGWQNILLSLFMAAAVALVIIILITPLKKKFPIGEAVPFGPALSVAMLICYYFGAPIISWYRNMVIGAQ